MKILITGPSLSGKGGVACYYNSVLPYLSDTCDIKYFELGSENNRSYLHPLSDQLNFFRLISKCNYNLVLINPSLGFKSFIRDGLLIWQAKSKSLPVLVFYRGWEKNFEQIVKYKLFWFFKKTYGRADRFIVLATEFKEVLQNWGISQPIHQETTTVNTSLLENFSISKRLEKLTTTQKIKILFLARLEREKGIFETIDAVCILIQKGFSVSLSIAGDGVIMDELQAYVKEKKISGDCIHFLGYIENDDKIDAFTDHHIYCFPTYYCEGLPNSLLEAMSFGMPVVTRPVGGIKDFFQNSKMGYLTESIAPEAISECLTQIISDKTKLCEMSRYNYDYAKKHFMADKCAKKIIAICDKTS